MKDNNNLKNFATEVSKVIGHTIGLDHIHPSTEGRYYYIQSPKTGAPILFQHYRGPICLDIHPDDFKAISSGKVSANEYISTANWQIGYYWGGGSMIGGGYYQPINLVERKEEVKRYLTILSCRTFRRASGYIPDKEKCTACDIENCPFSHYREGDWNAEMLEYDPRRDLFKALRKRFDLENPGYTLRGFLCGEIPDEEVWLSPNWHYGNDNEPFAFTAYASSTVIRSLLMRETTPASWDEYAKRFQFKILSRGQTIDITPKTLEEAFE